MGSGASSDLLELPGLQVNGIGRTAASLNREGVSDAPISLPGGDLGRAVPDGGEPSSVAGVFERFTDRARRALVLAQEESRLLSHSVIGTEHLLLGLIAENEGVAATALKSFDISLATTRTRVEELIGLAATAPTQSPQFTPRVKKVFELSLREALDMGHSYIGTEHLLLGLIQEGEGVAIQVLHSFEVDIHHLRRNVVEHLSGHETAQSGEGAGGMSQSAAEPRCTGCRSQLSETARFRSIEIPPTTPSPSPITVEVVFCNRCGSVFGTFRDLSTQ